MIDLIPAGVLALVLGAYGLVMLRRRTRLHAVAAELGGPRRRPAITSSIPASSPRRSTGRA